MKATELTRSEHGGRFALVFDLGDEVVGQLTTWCNEHGITAARFTGIGGFRDGTTRGGHLIAGHVCPTVEQTVDQAPAHVRRRCDPDIGLALIVPEI